MDEKTLKTRDYAFPTRLRELMKSTGTRQWKLAQAVGVRPQTISLYTQGQSFPDVNKLAKIARFFSVSADYLIGITDSTKPYLSISEYMGLSEKAVAVIKSLSSEGLDGLNAFLESMANRKIT